MRILYNLGWQIFPCNGKVPSTPHGYKDGVAGAYAFETLKAKYQGNNVGVVTGAASGVWVLDIDVKKGAKGAQSLDRLVKKHGVLPVTPTAQTWSGGTHYYFKMPPAGMGNRTNVLPGIDVRGTGGYVIAPPSVIEGKDYTWLHSPETTPLAEAPEWLIELLKEKKVELDPGEGMIKSGARNSELASRAGKMRAAGMESNQIFAALLTINATRCSPPLSEKEVRQIAESVGKYAPGEDSFSPTDSWNSERFADQYGRDVRWCPTLGWLSWAGTHWQRRGKDDPALMGMARELVRGLFRQAEATGNTKLRAHALKCESVAKLSAIIELAKSEPGICVSADALDRDLHLLNCENGTLNLKTGDLQPHKREDLITKCINLPYDVAAECPTWLKFLAEVFQNDQGLVDYVQRAVGYCLSGYTTEQKFFICYGNGRNGKSTLLKHIMKALGGSYATATPAETMLEATGNTLHAIASLKGMRLVVLNEFDEGKSLSSAQVKTLTGGEPVVARHLYHEQFIYTPTYKFFMTTNHKPRIKDTSLGIWRRLVLLPFDFTVPLDRVDPALDAKLDAEAAGILNWAVKGHVKWMKQGLGELERLTKEATIYQGQSDLIGQFLEESMDPDVDPLTATTRVTEFIEQLAIWCRENGIRYAPGRNAVIDYMARRGYGQPVAEWSAIARGRLAWKGIAIIHHKAATSSGWSA